MNATVDDRLAHALQAHKACCEAADRLHVAAARAPTRARTLALWRLIERVERERDAFSAEADRLRRGAR